MIFTLKEKASDQTLFSLISDDSDLQLQDSHIEWK